jgi:hypothetical protein
MEVTQFVQKGLDPVWEIVYFESGKSEKSTTFK